MALPSRRRQHKVVLIIDDDRVLCDLVEEILTQSLNCKVLVAETAGRGLELLNALKVDAIILDYWLPDMDGLRLYDLLRRRPAFSSVPVLFITAAPQAPELRSRRISDILAKPFDLEEFIERVRAMLQSGS